VVGDRGVVFGAFSGGAAGSWSGAGATDGGGAFVVPSMAADGHAGTAEGALGKVGPEVEQHGPFCPLPGGWAALAP